MTTETPRLPARLIVGAVCLYAAAAVLLTWPLAAHLADHLVSHENLANAADPLLNAYLLSWGAHALVSAPLALFQANIFYPAPDALAFSDTLLGIQPIFGPLSALAGSPVLAYNLTFLSAFVLNGLAMAGLAWFLFARPTPALAAGFLYAFALPRFAHLTHLQLCSAWWIPLALLSVEAWFRRPRRAVAALLAVLIWLQFLSSAYLGIMLGLLLIPYLAVRARAERRRVTFRLALPHLGAALCVGAVLLLPVALPYARSQAQWGHQRGLADLVRYSAQPASLLAADRSSWLYGTLTAPLRRRDVPWESALFAGLAPLALAALGFLARRRTPHAAGTAWEAVARALTAFGATALILALGPILIWADAPAQWPLPYLGLFLGIPGLGGMRAPARFALLALAPLALLGAGGVARLTALVRERRVPLPRPDAVVGGLVLLVLTVEALHLPVPLQPIAPADGPLARHLRSRAQTGAVLELPVSVFEPLAEATYALRSTRHWAPLVNGYSGFRPGSYFEIAVLVNGEGPTRRVVEALSALGVRTLAVHLSSLTEPERARWLGNGPAAAGLEPALGLPELRVFHLPPGPPRVSPLEAALSLPDRLPAGCPLRVRLRLLAPAGGPWINPGPLGVRSVRLAWVAAGSGTRTEHDAPGYIPTLLPAGGEASLVLPTKTPGHPGVYRLEIETDGFRVTRRLTVTADPPPAGSLQAEVAWLGPRELRVGAGQSLQLAAGVRNAGLSPWQDATAGSALGVSFRRLFPLGGFTLWWAAVERPELGGEWPIWGAGEHALWLAAPQSTLGRFAVQGRWVKDGAVVSTSAVPVPHDIFPGESFPAVWIVRAPPSPGRYTLELAVWGPDLRPLFHPGGAARVPVTIEGAGRRP